MRAIDCRCGHRLEAADDEELIQLARDHRDSQHPEMQRTDAQIRERVASDAYDACPSARSLPWTSPRPNGSAPRQCSSRRSRRAPLIAHSPTSCTFDQTPQGFGRV
jgi:hypothetical protein